MIGRSERGAPLCGFRIFPARLLLSRRRRSRYARARRRWEALYRLGVIGAARVQQGYASALEITAHADALGFRREELRRGAVVDC